MRVFSGAGNFAAELRKCRSEKLMTVFVYSKVTLKGRKQCQNKC